TPDQPPDYAALAADAWRKEETPPPVSSLGDRAGEVAAIERALRARAWHRRRPWLVAAGALAAGVAFLLVSAGQGPRPSPVTQAPEPAAPRLASPLSVVAIDGAGAVVETEGRTREASVDAEIASGARLRLPQPCPGSDLGVDG